MFNGLVEDWVTQGLGVGYAPLLLERRIGLPTVRVEAEFKATSRMGDRVALRLACVRLGTRSLTLQLECRAVQGGELRMAMRQVLVTTSLQTHRAIDSPPDLHAAIARSGVTPAGAAR